MATRQRVTRKSKGKRHPLHAESLERMADELEANGNGGVALVFRAEARRIRSILR